MTARLPTPDGDENDWGTVLNDFLSVSLNSDGTLSSAAVNASGGAVGCQDPPVLQAQLARLAGREQRMLIS